MFAFLSLRLARCLDLLPAQRWAANEASTAAAGDVRRDAAIRYKEESAMREKRDAEAKVLEQRLARHKARVKR